MFEDRHCLTCARRELIRDHKNGDKNLFDFTEMELQNFPLYYLIDNVRPMELLADWQKLPLVHRENFDLQVQLPCFIHHNRPEWQTHVDCGPPSQATCHLCNWSLQQCV